MFSLSIWLIEIEEMKNSSCACVYMLPGFRHVKFEILNSLPSKDVE